MRLRNRFVTVQVVAAVLVLLVLAACGPTPTSTPLPTAVVTRALTATPEPTVAPTLAPTARPASTPVTKRDDRPSISLSEATAPLEREFEGEGSQLSEPVVVANGVLVLMANYEGEGDFAVSMLGDEGELEPYITSQGPYFGNLLISVYRDNVNGMEPGSHQLNVTADGPWRVRLMQDFPISGQAPTIQFGGVGDGGGGWMELEVGTYTIRANHDGESHFKVMLHNVRGRPEVLLLDEPGPFDETITMEVSEEEGATGPTPGVYGIGVLADGIWSLIIESADTPSP